MAIAELDRRTRELLERLADLRDDVEDNDAALQDSIRELTPRLEHEVTDLRLQDQRVAIGGIYWESVGLLLTGAGLVIQALATNERLPRMARALRFGAQEGERYSQYWKASAAATRPELVVSGNRVGRFFHLTMHENDAFWHAKVKVPGAEVVHPWQPPQMWLPGVRRLLQILVPIEAVRYELERTAAERVTWFPGPPDDQSWTEFTILHCARGRPEIRSAIVLGAVQIADGSEAVVIARSRPAEALTTPPVTRTVSSLDADEIRRKVKESDTAMLMSGLYRDGCLWILELMSRPRDAANPPA